MRYDPVFLLLLMSVVVSASDVAQSVKLREAIKEYEANKWKVIGQKVGKPAKVSVRSSCMSLCFPSNRDIFRQACEQYAKEHFKNV